MKNPTKKIDYSKVDLIIKESPDISHKEFKEKCPIIMSAWGFYNRKKFLFTGKPYKNSNKKPKNGEKKADNEIKIIPTKRKKTLYSIMFEKEANGISKESRELLQSFISELNKRKNMELEIIEVISPNHKLEVRSY